VGYRQVWRFLHGDGDLEALEERAVAATRQLARRQLTWLRKENDITRFDCSGPWAAARVTRHFARSAGGG
jgi:tRNA dimethylallyltransferase